MRGSIRRLLVPGLFALAMMAPTASPARAEPIQPDFPQTLPKPLPKPGAPASRATPAPAVIPGARCIAAVVTEDTGTSDAFLYRELFLRPHGPQRRDGMAVADPSAPCPPDAVRSAARNALIACRERAINPSNCVYGDMDHNFMITTDVSDSSAEHSVVLATEARYLGIACVPIGGIDVCSIASGNDAAAAVEAARARCKRAHGDGCVLTNAVPVAPPADPAADAPATHAAPARPAPPHPVPYHPTPLHR
ncbi:MAG: hypothetical protein KGL12_13745 [Rhodospirillales bacterium]|nr:hypothetical protein [Rhodospirillales bacterium]